MENTSMSAEGTSSTESTASDGQVSDSGVAKESLSAADEEMVEIALGSVKGKIPKSMAEAVKNFERGARKALEEGSMAKRQLKEFESHAKANPRAFFEKNGIDPYEFAESTLAEKLEMMAMSPEQKELMETKTRLQQYEEREKAAQEEHDKLQHTKQERELIDNFDKEITEAFKASGLPKHKLYIQQIAAEMLGATKRNEDLPAAKAALRVKERFETHVREILENMDAEAIQKILSATTRKKLREFEVQKVTANAAPTPDSGKRPGSNPASAAPAKAPSKPLSEREWRDRMASLKS